MVTYSYAAANLSKAREEACNWTSGSIPLTVATSVCDDTDHDINLSDTIGHNCRAPVVGKRNDSNCYFLQSSFNENTELFRVNELYPLFILACRDAGFKVRGNYSSRLNSVSFSCWRSRFYNQDKSMEYYLNRDRNVKNPLNEPKTRKRKTPLPTKGDLGNDIACKFKFFVYWDNNHKRWFLPHKQSGCINHCGHMHTTPSLLRSPAKVAGTTEEVLIAKDAMASEASATSAVSLFEQRTGHHLEWHQLHYLKRKERQHLTIHKNGGGRGNKSAADRLIHQLTTDKKKSFICLFADYSTGLLKIKTKKYSSNGTHTEEDFTDDLGDDIDNPELFAETLRSDDNEESESTSDNQKGRANLQLSDSGQILLAIAWTADESRRLFDMFPEFVGGDDTEQTNSEDRPLYTLLGKDNNNKSFPILWAFMPSKAQWVFTWIFKHALPTLHPGTALQRVQLFATDADPQETRAAEGVVGDGKKEPMLCFFLLPKARHRWCGWHRIDRNLVNGPDYKAVLSEAKNHSVESRVEVDVIIRYMWYLIKHYEDANEVQCSLTFLKHYLSEEDQSEHFGEIKNSAREKIREFITKSFEPHRFKLFEAFFEGMTMNNCTTCINEAEHRSYHHSALGPRPKHDIAESAGKISKLTDMKNAKKAKKTAFDINATFSKAEDRDAAAKDLSDYCNLCLGREVAQESKYEMFCSAEDSYYVKRNYDEYDTLPHEDLNLQINVCEQMTKLLDIKAVEKSSRKKFRELKDKLLGFKRGALPEYLQILYKAMNHIIPRFEHTRRLNVIQWIDGEWLLTCSCRIYEKTGHACRHMYRLLKRTPKTTDAKVRWHIGYSHYYGVNASMSNMYRDMRDSFDMYPGIPITAEERKSMRDLCPVGYGTANRDYFERSLDKLYLRGNDSYWHSRGHCFPNIDQSCFGSYSGTSDSNVEDTIENDIESRKGSPVFTNDQPAGASQQMSSLSTYMVPSQTQPDSEEEDKNECVPGNNRDSYVDFLPHYQRICKLADSQGQSGKNYLRQLLNHGAKELHAEANRNDGKKVGGGMSSFPKITNKRVAIRKRKASSPRKK